MDYLRPQKVYLNIVIELDMTYDENNNNNNVKKDVLKVRRNRTLNLDSCATHHMSRFQMSPLYLEINYLFLS